MQFAYTIFKVTDTGKEFKALLTFNPADPWPWTDQKIFFITSSDLSQQERNANLKTIENATYYDLVVVESEEREWFKIKS